MLESIEATPCNFAVFSPEGNLVAWNSSYEKLHSHAFATLPQPLQYVDLMREAARRTLPSDQVETAVAERVARHFTESDSIFERLYPAASG
ncbi:MAG: PAS-domain containing protein [Acetobacteraceae bacterium]